MSAGFFKKLKAGTSQMGEDFIGPDYRYQDFIKTPKEQGMSGDGNFDALAKNIGGIINYSNILVKGTGPAKIGNDPLGNKFFLKTAGKCAPASKTNIRCDAKKPCPSSSPTCFKNECWKPVKNWKGGDGELKAQRWLFIDNTTKGKLPFIRGESSFKGIVPGMLENIMEMNPVEVLTAFGQEATPLCRKITSRVSRSEKRKGRNHYIYSNKSKYVALKDLPEGFTQRFANLENKPLLNLYNTGFGFLLVYIIFCVMKKN